MHSKFILPAILLLLLLPACSSDTAETETIVTTATAATSAVTTETVTAAATTTPPATSTLLETTSAAATTVPPETQLATTETSAEPTTDPPAEEVDDTAEMYLFTGYGCAIEIPMGWTPTQGAQGGTLTDTISVYQPDTPNGDSIALYIEEAAEDPDDFASLTAVDLASAYSEALDTVAVHEFESITVDGCAAYRMTLAGSASDITVQIRQLIVNDPTRGYWYSLTYSNYTGDSSVYPADIEQYFSLT